MIGQSARSSPWQCLTGCFNAPTLRWIAFSFAAVRPCDRQELALHLGADKGPSANEFHRDPTHDIGVQADQIASGPMRVVKHLLHPPGKIAVRSDDVAQLAHSDTTSPEQATRWVQPQRHVGSDGQLRRERQIASGRTTSARRRLTQDDLLGRPTREQDDQLLTHVGGTQIARRPLPNSRPTAPARIADDRDRAQTTGVQDASRDGMPRFVNGRQPDVCL